VYGVVAGLQGAVTILSDTKKDIAFRITYVPMAFSTMMNPAASACSRNGLEIAVGPPGGGGAGRIRPGAEVDEHVGIGQHTGQQAAHQAGHTVGRQHSKVSSTLDNSAVFCSLFMLNQGMMPRKDR